MNGEIAVIESDDALELQRKYAEQIVRAVPGLGPVSAECARTLVDSGLGPRMALEIIKTVAHPERSRGQGNKVRFFTEAVVKHLGENYIEKAGRNAKYFARLVTTVDEIEELRQTLKEEGYNVSYSNAAFLSLAGLSAESTLAKVVELRQTNLDEGYQREGYWYMNRIVSAAKDAVRTGYNIETLLDFGSLAGFETSGLKEEN